MALAVSQMLMIFANSDWYQYDNFNKISNRNALYASMTWKTVDLINVRINLSRETLELFECQVTNSGNRKFFVWTTKLQQVARTI